MKDVSAKPDSLRSARAEATLRCLPATIAALRAGNVPKADPLAVARVAGVQAAKSTSTLIPYCHQVPLDFVGVEVDVQETSLTVRTEVKALWKTGVEMEALVAASTAALTLYDMLKAIDATMEVTGIRLLEKKGGKSDVRPVPLTNVRAGILVMSDLGGTGSARGPLRQGNRGTTRRVRSQGRHANDHSR